MRRNGPLATTRPLSITACLVGLVAWGLATPARAELDAQEQAPGIYTGTAPTAAEDFEQLRCLGVQTIVDMRKFRPRDSRREQALAAQYGIAYHAIPLGFYPTHDDAPQRVLQLLAACADRPVYLHCQLGRDRTGLIIALYRVRHLGWSPEAAYAAMEQQEFNPLLRDLDRYFWRSVRCF
ncbi:fused DSP-PTPase phosphatase/NAD kinase-like protein [Candidatus Laterigemmans baculatus]|uniref:fused DSP-PTPase phosphatase/NAD kinase-like protein n=1 Tax=Candidatus Laterigemmans baculatus TaxID=2770505 RepID=UPI0013DAFBE3|nr:tyrosine-protein phosphatase [Candidatus Laterigemmans baculatus]